MIRSVLLLALLVTTTIGCQDMRTPATSLYDQGFLSLVYGQRAEAIRFYRKASDKGHAKSKVALGILDDGGSVMSNLHLALTDPSRGQSDWYELALGSLEEDVANGDEDAKIMLAIMLERGLGGSPDPERATSLLQEEPRSAEDDFWLGWIFERRGYFPLAKKFYTSAAQDGVATAYTSLALMYMEGRGVESSFGTAMALLRVAYDRGDRGAGELYESYLNKAVRSAALGDTKALRNLEQFRRTGLREYTMSG